MCFAGIWVVLLFVAKPEWSIISGAVDQLNYSLDPGADHFVFFLVAIVSPVLCCTYAVMFWFCKYPRIAMALVGMNVVLMLTMYSWDLVIVVAAPLLYAKRVVQNA